MQYYLGFNTLIKKATLRAIFVYMENQMTPFNNKSLIQ